MSIKQGDYLKKLRTENKLSQEKLAEKLGVSRQSISKWEQGYAVPDTDNMFKLSKLYGLSVDEILNCGEAEKTDSANSPVPPAANTGAQAAVAEKAKTESDTKKDEHKRPAKKKRSWLFYAYPFIAIFAMVALGVINSSLWKSSWLCLLTIPVFYTAVISREKKDMRIFCYPALVLIAFFAGGFHLSLWHPLWLLFITIPIYYICAFVTHKNKKR